MLTTAEIASMRATADLALPSTCTISRQTLTTDDRGGKLQAWATVATVACRVGPAKTQPNNGIGADKVQTVAAWPITLPANTDARVTDRITVGSRVFEVDIVQDRSYEIALRVLATEVL